MQEIDLQQLKDDPKLKQNLQKLVQEAKEEQSVAKAYSVLDASLLLEEDDEKIDSLFAEVLQISFDDLAQKLTNKTRFNCSDDEDLARMRAIYEHAIEKYSTGDYVGAKEIFLVLYHMFDSISYMQKPMAVHIVAAAKEIDFDTFFESYTDPKAISEDLTRYAHFIKHFSIDVDAFLEENDAILQEAFKELDGLKA